MSHDSLDTIRPPEQMLRRKCHEPVGTIQDVVGSEEGRMAVDERQTPA
jgi:hypothetical protein